MFLFRSFFWLTAAFLIIAPAARIDLQETARTAPWAVLSAVSTHVPQIHCETLECVTGRTMLTAAAASQAQAVTQPMPAALPTPAPGADPLAALIAEAEVHDPAPVAPRPIPRPATL